MLRTTIPYSDQRGKPLTDLLRCYPDKAHALLRAGRRSYGVLSLLASFLLLPFFERRSHAWLKRQKNPYLHDIEAANDILAKRGMYTLNLAYEWACTSGVYLVNGKPQLFRALDWPMPALGEHLVVAQQEGNAGTFYNLTWPGFFGVMQGLAPERFAATINLAPMRRHGLGLVGDWFVNRLRLARCRALPASHLLRYVFENARHYSEAKRMLCETPIATPAIFILSGLEPGEGCIIERLETEAEVIEMSVSHTISTTNEFQGRFLTRGKGWRPREIDSAGRLRQSRTITAHDMQLEDFGWVRPPILNVNTRLVMIADASKPMLRLQGYQGQGAVTEIFRIS